MHPAPTERADEAETAMAAIRARGEAVRREELRRAFASLESDGELTAEQRRVLAEMATAVVDGILAGPRSALRDDGRRELARTAVELFDAGER